MQKRRGQRRGGELPLTEQDLHTTTGNSTAGGRNRRRHRRKRARSGVSDTTSRLSLLLSGLAIMTFGLVVLLRLSISPTIPVTTTTSLDSNSAYDHRIMQERTEALPLSEFPTLTYPLAHSKLLGVYFAAAWCPVSTPVTERIHSYLDQSLLAPPPSSEEESGTKRMANLSLVYVSSDRNKPAFEEYKGTNWNAVAYENVEERTALKRYFHVCAKPEKEPLRVDRKAGIPSLLIIDTETRQVLTTKGADDLEEHQEKVVDYWIGLREKEATTRPSKRITLK